MSPFNRKIKYSEYTNDFDDSKEVVVEDFKEEGEEFAEPSSDKNKMMDVSFTSSSSRNSVTSHHHHHHHHGRLSCLSGDGSILPVDIIKDEEEDDNDGSCFYSRTWSMGDDPDDEDGGHHHCCCDPTADEEQAERDIFDKARQFLDPGPVLKYAIYLFGERKLFAFFCLHFTCTMVIFTHFFLIKFEEKAAGVPEGSAHYWWKRLVPPLEFGTMHAILFQMALIPLTMSRYSIASASDTVINKFIPLNRTIRMHIHLGYTICGLLILSTILFLLFFGLMCADGDQSFCSKFTSEIMCTGYGIIASILLLLGTSYFRNRIPYEIFYGIHHIIFVFYALSIAHTLDEKQRNHEQERSQTFKWFSATLCYYLCDRLAMYFSQRYNARLVSSSAIEGSNGSRMIILRLRRPPIFAFKPGQYAFLRLKEIDLHWHPFSIASGPASSYLEFYIEVMKKNSWTDKLWDILEGDGNGGFSNKQIDFEVLGPCGTALAKFEDFSHALVVGTGSGIVPILSLYKQHVRQLLRLDPWSHFADLENHRRKIMAAETALQPRQGSLVKKLLSSCVGFRKGNEMDDSEATHMALGPNDALAESIRDKIQRHERMMRWRDVKDSIKVMKSEAFEATRSIYGVVLLSIMPAIGALLMGLTISVNTTTAKLTDEMTNTLQLFSSLFYGLFGFIALCLWDGNQLGAYTDAAVFLVSPFATWYFFLQYSNHGRLSPSDITTYCLLTGYMTLRMWSCTVKSHHRSWRKSVDTEGIDALEKLELCWVSRSASSVAELMPDIDFIWDALAEQWGKENAAKVCKISVYVTDKDKEACALLRTELSGSQLFQDGAIKFGRPEFAKIIEDHTLRMILTKKKSCSLLAFCGSQEVAQEIQRQKVSNDMVCCLTGHKANHQMEFVSESYGGEPKKSQQCSDLLDARAKDCHSTTKSLTTRTIISYHHSKGGRKYLV